MLARYACCLPLPAEDIRVELVGRMLTVSCRQQGPTGGGASSDGGSGAGLLPDLAALLPAVFGLPAGGAVEQCSIGPLCCPLIGCCLIATMPAQSHARYTHSLTLSQPPATLSAHPPPISIPCRGRPGAAPGDGGGNLFNRMAAAPGS